MTVGEFDLIARLAPYLSGDGEGVPVGHGDDAAVLKLGRQGVCLAVDVVVENRHFLRSVSSPEDVGWKSLAVNVSDLAAMGAVPVAAVVGLCRPAGWSAEDITRLYAGMQEAAERWDVKIVGGDTVAADELVVSVTAVGTVAPARAVRRSGARPGDLLVLVGELGAAAAALAQVHVGGDPDPALLAAHRRPRALPDAGFGLAAAGATAMIDLSDGLGADLGHICAASGVGARVNFAALPVAAGVVEAAESIGRDPVDLVCGGGEDFALLAAVPAGRAEEACTVATEAEGVPATVIGHVMAYRGDTPAVLHLTDGTRRYLAGMGFDHYGEQT